MSNSDYFRVLVERLEKEKVEQEQAKREELENHFKSWRVTIGKQIEQAYKLNLRSICVAKEVPKLILDELQNQGFQCKPNYKESIMTNNDVLIDYQVTFPEQKK